jgi:hypothetical protein
LNFQFFFVGLDLAGGLLLVAIDPEEEFRSSSVGQQSLSALICRTVATRPSSERSD